MENTSILRDEKTSYKMEVVDNKVVNAVKKSCFRCGETYSPLHLQNCRAKNAVCRSCQKKGHYQKFCRNKTEQRRVIGSVTNDIQERNSIQWYGNEGNVYKIFSNYHSNKNSNNFRVNSSRCIERWEKEYEINTQKIKFKIDTGSDVNCISVNIVKKLNLQIVKCRGEFNVFDYSSNKIEIL